MAPNSCTDSVSVFFFFLPNITAGYQMSTSVSYTHEPLLFRGCFLQLGQISFRLQKLQHLPALLCVILKGNSGLFSQYVHGHASDQRPARFHLIWKSLELLVLGHLLVK